jgi:hypothetical protein
MVDWSTSTNLFSSQTHKSFSDNASKIINLEGWAKAFAIFARFLYLSK